MATHYLTLYDAILILSDDETTLSLTIEAEPETRYGPLPVTIKTKLSREDAESLQSTLQHFLGRPQRS